METTNQHQLTTEERSQGGKQGGKKGGETTKARYGIDRCPCCGRMMLNGYYSDLAQQGGQAVVEKYGREHMREIGKKGGRPRKDVKNAN